MNVKIKVGSLIINNKGDVLLIKEKYKKNKFFLWNIISGTYGDSGEETLFEAAKRECYEEVSVKVELTNALGCYISGDSNDLRAQFVFFAKIVYGVPKLPTIEEQAKRAENIFELKWFSKEEILRMTLDKFISDRIHTMLMDWINGNSYSLKIFKHI